MDPDVAEALTASADATLLRLRLVPRAGRTELAGMYGDAVKLRVAAPPVDGRANAEAVAYLAALLGVAKSDVQVVAGHRARDKVVRVAGLSPKEVVARLR